MLVEASGGRDAEEPVIGGPVDARSSAITGAGVRWQALRIVGPVMAVLALAALLNADHLLDRAEKKPFGENRDRWVATWEPVRALSDALFLNRPRQVVDHLLDRELDRFQSSGVLVTADEARKARAGGSPGTPDPDAPPAPGSAPEPVKPRLRTPTADAPLRLWVGGDSMTVSFGASLVRLSAATGLITPEEDARSSTGLTRPDFFDWPARLAAIIENQDPEVMVVMFGANDAQGIKTADGKIFQTGSEGWTAEYRLRVRAAMDVLDRKDRLVIWVGQPVMEGATHNARMAELNAIYREEAAKRPGILFFDSWSLFVDGNGAYSQYLEIDGEVVQMRLGDGVHLSRQGADRLANAVLERLDQETDVLR